MQLIVVSLSINTYCLRTFIMSRIVPHVAKILRTEHNTIQANLKILCFPENVLLKLLKTENFWLNIWKSPVCIKKRKSCWHECTLWH